MSIGTAHHARTTHHNTRISRLPSFLMRSYNAVNGVPSCANDWLLKTVARGEWGFDGYVTSDCGADNDVFFNHHYTKTAEESVAAILKAGTDVDCGGFIGKYAQNALNKSLIVEADLDERLKYLFTMRMRLGHFDPIGAMGTIPASADLYRGDPGDGGGWRRAGCRVIEE